LFPTPSSSASCWLPLSSAANRLFGVEKSRDTASPRPERTAANNQKGMGKPSALQFSRKCPHATRRYAPPQHSDDDDEEAGGRRRRRRKSVA